MNAEMLYEAMDGIDETLIDDANRPSPSGSRRAQILAWAAAAVLAAGVGTTMFIGSRSAQKQQGADTPKASDEAVIHEVSGDPEGSAEVCWIPFFVHDGCQYISETELAYDSDVIGRYLGTSVFAAEYNKQISDYAELTGSVAGPVYELKGVDPTVLLCVRHEDGVIQIFKNRRLDPGTVRELISGLLSEWREFTGYTLEDCCEDELLGAFVPRAVPKGYSLVYACIYRIIDEETGRVIGTDRIEYELHNDRGHYICVNVRPGPQGQNVSVSMERVEAARASGPDNYGVVLKLDGAVIEVKGCFGAKAGAVFEVIDSIGK